ncbi:hypothetical protein O988_03887, partial [Pseudogymnoascus sp. VKM F-3808]
MKTHPHPPLNAAAPGVRATTTPAATATDASTGGNTDTATARATETRKPGLHARATRTRCSPVANADALDGIFAAVALADRDGLGSWLLFLDRPFPVLTVADLTVGLAGDGSREGFGDADSFSMIRGGHSGGGGRGGFGGGRGGRGGGRGGGDSGGGAGDDNALVPHDGRPPPEKKQPNFAPTGLLAAETKTVTTNDGSAVVLKYHEPPEARKPPARDAWKLFVFKNGDIVDTIDLGRRSCWLIGRDASIADLPAEHPSISKQHAVIQF